MKYRYHIEKRPEWEMRGVRTLAKFDNRADDPAATGCEWWADEAGKTEWGKTRTMLSGIIFCLLRQTNRPLGTAVFVHP